MPREREGTPGRDDRRAGRGYVIMFAGMGLDVADPITLLAVRDADGAGGPLFLGALDAAGLHRLAWDGDDDGEPEPDADGEFPHVRLTIAADGRVTIADRGDGLPATLRAADEGRTLVLVGPGGRRPSRLAGELSKKGCV